MKDKLYSFIKKYYLLNRAKVCDDISLFTNELNTLADGKIFPFMSNEECLNWTIPQKWEVNEAWVKNSKGTTIIDFKWHPLYLMTYSNSFYGILSKEELLQKVLTDKKRPDCLIYNHRQQYKYKNYPNWGFSLPYNKVKDLPTDTKYEVNIDCSFSEGNLLVSRKHIPGKNKETVFFAAHTCHPGLVNDGIAGIAILLELIQFLSSQQKLKYSYDFIFGPEYYAGACMLSQSSTSRNLKSGFFLDMMGNGQDLGFSKSFSGNAYVDFVTESVMKKSQSNYLTRDYRKLWGNDEIFYDGPDFRIPTIGLGRDRWEHYHTDKDDLENCDLDQLIDSYDFLTQVIDLMENDYIPIRKYKGPLYLDRYSISFDSQGDPEGYSNIQKIQILADGTKSVSEISRDLGVSYYFVYDFLEILFKKDLIAKEPYNAFDE
jgi:aminopeptidase-like protein